MKLKLFGFLIILVTLFLSVNVKISAQVPPRTQSPVNDPDINIRLRGWSSASFSNQIVDYGVAEADFNAPQLSISFNPSFANFFQVRDRSGQGIDQSQITPFSEPGLGEIQATQGNNILAPPIGYSIGGGFNYVILYATSRDIVIHATAEDSVANGYTVHFLNIAVNPALLDLYNQNEASGRKDLVAIPCKFLLGTVSGGNPLVTVRDTGSFQDIRSLDWWRGGNDNCQNIAPGKITAGSSAPTPARPFDFSQEVPCQSTTVPPLMDPEFHSLRPYPANPCDKQASDTTLLCSNDLVVVKSTSPGANGNCSPPNADGSYTCTYTDVAERVNVSIDLAGAELPIMGNTEDVPNGTWTSPNTNAPNMSVDQRMNGYVSWYLNGVVDRAEEDFSAYDPKYLVNYSGPLNKLLPFIGQQVSKIAGVKNTASTPAKIAANPSIADPSLRHNAVVGCDYDTLALPCYVKDVSASFISQLIHVIVGTPVIDVRRLVDFSQRLPPLESDPGYRTFSEYWKAYLTWEGKICSPSLFGFYLCSNLQQFWPSAFFPNIPLANTEDRVGTIGTTAVNQAGSCTVSGSPCVALNCADGTHVNGDVCPGQTPQSPTGTFSSCNAWANEACLNHGGARGDPNNPLVGGVTTSSSNGVTFTPSSATSYQHNLYFAHMQEDAELAAQLQNTFKPQSITSTHDVNTKPDIKPGCIIQNSESNPGDSLHGDINRTTYAGATDQKVDGTVNFKATYTCTFTPNSASASGTLVGNLPAGVTCGKAIASLGIFTQTPLAQQNWDSLVGGNMSVFKKMYPKVGVNTPVTEIKEIPASSKTTYQATDGNGVAAGSTTTAGDGAASATGIVYFPYIGGIKDYFLEGIQKALRPQSTSSLQPQPGTLSCQLDGSGLNSNVLKSFIIQASNWAHIPVQALVALVHGEACQGGGPLCNASDADVTAWSQPNAQLPYNCVSGLRGGPLGFGNVAWDNYKNAVNMATGEGRTPNVCNVKDAVYAAAYTLSSVYGGNGCAHPGYSVSNTKPASSWNLADTNLALTGWACGCTIVPSCSAARGYYLGSSYTNGAIVTSCNQ
jgi:hypothetical protein